MKSQKKLQLLQTKWYKILKESGFDDIEDVHSPMEKLIQWHSQKFIRKVGMDSDISVLFPELKKKYYFSRIEETLDYYLKAGHFLESYNFTSHLIKEIWRMHSEGLSLREISTQFKTCNIDINKDKINSIVNRLKKEMLGG